MNDVSFVNGADQRARSTSLSNRPRSSAIGSVILLCLLVLAFVVFVILVVRWISSYKSRSSGVAFVAYQNSRPPNAATNSRSDLPASGGGAASNTATASANKPTEPAPSADKPTEPAPSADKPTEPAPSADKPTEPSPPAANKRHDDAVSVVNDPVFSDLNFVALNPGPSYGPIETKDPINVHRARRYIAKKDKINNNLEKYNFKNEHDAVRRSVAGDEGLDSFMDIWEYKPDREDTDFSQWETKSSHLRALCSIMLDCVRFAHTEDAKVSTDSNPATSEMRKYVKKYLDDFVQRIVDKRKTFDENPNQPWGDEWYDFGVNLTAVLAQYLLLPDAILQKELSSIILLLVPDPLHACGSKRKAHAPLLLGPWFLANHTLGTLNSTTLNSKAYKDARATVIVELQRKPFARGLHMDGSFFAHSPPLPAYAALKETFNEKSLYYYYMDTSLSKVPTYNNVWHIPMRIICHPTIALGNTGLFGRPLTTRGFNAAGENNPAYRSPLGLAVMPFSKFLRYYTDECMFSVRGQDKNMAHTQVDAVNRATCRHWVQSRRIYRPTDTEESLKYPWPGLTHVTNLHDDESDMDKPKNRVLESRSPKNAWSFVLRYDRFGVMCQYYDIADYELNTYTELIIIDSNKKLIKIRLDTVMKETYQDVKYTRQNMTEFIMTRVSNSNEPKDYSFTEEIPLDGTPSTFTLNADKIKFPLVLAESPTKIEIRKYESPNVAVLYDNDAPKVVSFLELDKELNEMTITINKVHMNIKFDFVTNQYLVV